MTDTNIFPVRIHTHFGRVVLNHADGYLSPFQAAALGRELSHFTRLVSEGKHPATRLVYPDGRRVTESTNKPAYVLV